MNTEERKILIDKINSYLDSADTAIDKLLNDYVVESASANENKIQEAEHAKFKIQEAIKIICDLN